MSLGKLLLIPVCALWLAIESASGQTQAAGSESLQAIADRVIQARSNNSQALKQYTWNQRTETLKDGEVMSTLLEVIRYDSSGNEQRSILVQEAPKQKKRIAGRIQKKKMAEMKEWGANIKSFLMLYSLPDLASLNSFLSKASIKSTEVPGQIVLSSNGVIQPGDRMTMYIKDRDKSIQKTEVFTSHDKDSIDMDIFHGALPEGISYVRELKLNIKTRGIQLKVENFNFNRN